MRSKGVAYAIAAAALFGASTPFAKPLLGNASPLLVAGLLYLGSGLGLFIVRFARRARATGPPLSGVDWLWWSAATLCGGIIGPVLLMTGLARSTAATASLLLNLEGIATASIAWLVFREHASRRTVVGMLLILLGAVVLAWSGTPSLRDALGPILIAGACLAWALDNNLTRNISGGDALEIASLKSIVAGVVNTALALVVVGHAALPGAVVLGGAAVVGFFGYGVSLVLYILALRELGAARTGAYFSTAPFIGAAIAVALGSATIAPAFFAAAAVMGIGVWLHVTEQHSHEHVHEAIEHEHVHVHDEHHQHEHSPFDPPGEPHVHRHRHAAFVHAHPHFPDLHHRHTH